MTILATYRNWKMDRGQDFRRRLTLKNKQTGAVIDLTGCSARLQIATRYGVAADLDLNSTDHPDALALGGAEGTLIVNLTDEQTGALPVEVAGSRAPSITTLVFTLIITFSDGTTSRLFDGDITLRRGIGA
ncbi:MAG: hypothetical protein Alpg2KO_00770 [Alphaproteobacteria bacterium]